MKENCGEQVGLFESQFAPRIAAKIASLFDTGIQVEVVTSEDGQCTTQLWITGVITKHWTAYPNALNVCLTWDPGEIARLCEGRREDRFERYLDALPRKLKAWQTARAIDFGSCSQAELVVLIGGLDFEA